MKSNIIKGIFDAADKGHNMLLIYNSFGNCLIMMNANRPNKPSLRLALDRGGPVFARNGIRYDNMVNFLKFRPFQKHWDLLESWSE